ncbi:MAG: hypothetical protein KAW41_04305 [Candidatus Diapherotrites archaeon]|nr:hypothetical protein [Candidatus Diapherotrites archaeon]
MKRNEAFFSLYENFFLAMKKDLGEEKALELFTKVMHNGLKKAYDASGFTRGSVGDFVRVITERDEGVGLRVELVPGEGKIIYRFLDDPFPNLKNKVDAAKLDATYIAFKVSYLLGDGWGYTTTKHLWRGDSFTEHVISFAASGAASPAS